MEDTRGTKGGYPDEKLHIRNCLLVDPIQHANRIGWKCVFEEDNLIHRTIRRYIHQFHTEIYQAERPGMRVLEIGPQIGNKMMGSKLSQYDSMDICSTSDPTYILDICNNNQQTIPDGTYDMIICLEVLEHVSDPKAAVKEMARMLRHGGQVFISTPFQFRLHGPMPDYWRISEYGFMELMRPHFVITKLNAISHMDKRQMFPLCYHVVGTRLDT